MFPKPSTSLSPLVFLNLIDDAGVAMLKEHHHFPRQSHTLWPHHQRKIKNLSYIFWKRESNCPDCSNRGAQATVFWQGNWCPKVGHPSEHSSRILFLSPQSPLPWCGVLSKRGWEELMPIVRNVTIPSHTLQGTIWDKFHPSFLDLQRTIQLLRHLVQFEVPQDA